MMRQPIESYQIADLRDQLRQIQDSSGRLAQRQCQLARDLARMLDANLTPPSPEKDLDRLSTDFYPYPQVEVLVETFLSVGQVRALRQQLLDVTDLAGDLAERHRHVSTSLEAALQEALELRHAEIEGQNDLGGEA